MDRVHIKYTLLMVLLLSTILLSPVQVYANGCTKCHNNPAYNREDINRLKECLLCHGTSDHPYKKEVISALQGAAKQDPATINKLSISNGQPVDPPQGGTTPDRSQGDTRDMVLIPAGEFIMGSNSRLPDERPAHVVYIDAFYIDKYEVTNEEYKKFVDATGHPPPFDWKNGTYPKDKGKYPVVFVDWYDANAYCKWLGKRLPRETEWEKAARGTDGRTYPWGNEWDSHKSNNPLSGPGHATPVGSYEDGKSPYGLYDMSGNVWEWVDDYYLPHPGSDYVNPEFGKKYRLLKGGSWMNCLFYNCGISAPTFNRAFFDPHTKNSSLGFRCAKDAK